MTRREVREQLFTLLFRVEFHDLSEMDEQTAHLFLDEEDSPKAASEEVSEKLSQIISLLPEIDKLISDNTTGWTVDRIAKVDLTILRLAVYEMKYDDRVPEAVAINEAVEIAKKYGQEESVSFVNAVLGKISKA